MEFVKVHLKGSENTRTRIMRPNETTLNHCNYCSSSSSKCFLQSWVATISVLVSQAPTWINYGLNCESLLNAFVESTAFSFHDDLCEQLVVRSYKWGWKLWGVSPLSSSHRLVWSHSTTHFILNSSAPQKTYFPCGDGKANIHTFGYNES